MNDIAYCRLLIDVLLKLHVKQTDMISELNKEVKLLNERIFNLTVQRKTDYTSLLHEKFDR